MSYLNTKLPEFNQYMYWWPIVIEHGYYPLICWNWFMTTCSGVARVSPPGRGGGQDILQGGKTLQKSSVLTTLYRKMPIFLEIFYRVGAISPKPPCSYTISVKDELWIIFVAIQDIFKHHTKLHNYMFINFDNAYIC